MTNNFLGYQHKISQQQLADFGQALIQDSFNNALGLRINYCHYPHPTPIGTVVISSGRVEGYLKYMEVIYDLHQLGYQVFAIDHLGQGLSERQLDNPHKGHISDFSVYSSDFSQFIEQVVQPKQLGPLLLLAHSMGGAIAIDYMQRHSNVIQAAALCAPMLGIKLPVSKWIINSLLQAMLLLGQREGYILGGDDYQPKDFAGNELTQDPLRYHWFRDLYEQTPQLQLGSPTNGWLEQAFDLCEHIQKQASALSTPTLILQAGADTIVSNQAQIDFNHQCSASELICIEASRHEILIEKDSIRDQAFSGIIQHFQKFA